MKRNYAVDGVKLLFAYVIALYHFGLELPPGAEVTVEIFFLFSGFFLARSFEQHREVSPWAYTFRHAKSVYPLYFLSVVIFFLYLLARSMLYFVLDPSLEKLWAMVLEGYSQIPDLMLLQSAYRFHESYNYPLWQVSALLIAGHFVYAMLYQNEKLAKNILFPAAFLLVESVLYYGADPWGSWGPFYVPLLRALAPLCLGALTWYFSRWEGFGQVKIHRLPFNLATVFAFVSIFLFGNRHNLHFFAAALVLLGCWTEGTWLNRLLNRKIFRSCGKLSLSIYVNHAFLARVLEARFASGAIPYPLQVAAYLLLLTAYSAALVWLVGKCARK